MTTHIAQGPVDVNVRALSELKAERETVQKQLDDAIVALQRYSRIRGVRRSDVAMASIGPARLKERLDKIDAMLRSNV